MKTKTFLLIVMLLIVTLLIALPLYQSNMGPHDGVVKKAGEYYIEMKNTDPTIYAFLLNKQLKTISNEGILCEASFSFHDNTITKEVLLPYNKDGFYIESGKNKFSFCHIYFNVYGITVSAEFENENFSVDKK